MRLPLNDYTVFLLACLHYLLLFLFLTLSVLKPVVFFCLHHGHPFPSSHFQPKKMFTDQKILALSE